MGRIIKLFLIVLFYSCISYAFSETSEIDSLQNNLTDELSIENELFILTRLAYLYRVKDPQKSIYYSETALRKAEENEILSEKQKAISCLGLGYKYLGDYDKSLMYQRVALQLAEELGKPKVIALENNRIGIIYKNLGLYSDALKYYEKALILHEVTKNEKGIANLYNNIGNVHRKRGDMDAALDYYFKTLELVEGSEEREDYAYILNNIGNLYSDLKIYDKALEYHQQSLEVKRELDHKFGISSSLMNIGNLYLDLGNPNKAFGYFDESMEMAVKYNYKVTISELLTSYGQAYLKLNQLEKAKDYVSQSIDQLEEIGNTSGMIDAYINASRIFIKQGIYSEARQYLEESLVLAQKENFLQDIYEIYLELSIIYDKTGNYKKSLEYYKLYSDVRDSVFNTEITNKITELRVQQKSEEFEAEKTILEDKNKFQQLSITRKNQFLYAMLAVTGLILILIILVYSRYHSKHKANKELGRINEQMAEKNIFQKVLMDTIPNPMYYKDKNGKYLGCNKAFSKMLGMEEHQIIGSTVFDIYEEANAKEFHKKDLEQLNRKGIFQEETSFETRDGNTRDVIMYKNTFNDKEGKVSGLVGVILDISERKQAEDRLRASENTLRHVNATKDKFFSIIAHDLTNPFNAILGFTNILHLEYEYLSDEEKLEIIENLSKASESTFRLLQNLLEWAKTQTGKLNILTESFDMSNVVNENISILSSVAHNKEIKVRSNVPFNTLVKADKNMIVTVVRNLISNAIKFTNKGGKIEITKTGMNGSIEICIADNGVGIDSGNLKKLFIIDQHLQTKGTANEMGSGLGLILCKEFMEKNSGQIRADSEPGKGSKFYISLPKG